MLTIFGQRRLAIDPQTLCDQFDLLLGPKVAEVIMSNTAFMAGKEQVSSLLNEKPDATVLDVIQRLIEEQRLSGVGHCKLTFRTEKSAELEIANPVVKPTSGAARMMLISRWSGYLSELLNERIKAEDVNYYEERDVLKCRLVPTLSGKTFGT